MNPIIDIIDNFFYYPHAVVNQLMRGKFEDFQLDVDGVTYPFINKDLPPIIQREMIDKIQASVGPIDPKYIFSRAMPHNHEAPNKIHSDIEMGNFSAHVYLSENMPEGTGTSFHEHKKLGLDALGVKSRTDIDGNNPAEWRNTIHVEAAFNRCLIHSAAAWHCAQPTTGFGGALGSARLVITCFFNLKGNA